MSPMSCAPSKVIRSIGHPPESSLRPTKSPTRCDGGPEPATNTAKDDSPADNVQRLQPALTTHQAWTDHPVRPTSAATHRDRPTPLTTVRKSGHSPTAAEKPRNFRLEELDVILDRVPVDAEDPRCVEREGECRLGHEHLGYGCVDVGAPLAFEPVGNIDACDGRPATYGATSSRSGPVQPMSRDNSAAA